MENAERSRGSKPSLRGDRRKLPREGPMGFWWFAANPNDVHGLSLEIKPGNRPFLQGLNEQEKLIINVSYFWIVFPTYPDSLLFKRRNYNYLIWDSNNNGLF